MTGDIDAAKGLGWFSVGLGAVEIAAPEWLGDRIDVGRHPSLVRAFGLREMMAGLWLLANQKPSAGLWARVAGDAMDLAALGAALRNSRARGRVAGAIAMVAGVTALDALYARRLQAHGV
ncbi:MAG: cyclase/dehydrase [Gemmatimonadetes bacterium]|nr:cyclase/dehydrase [Gemmatimonadota bacterium]